MHWDTSAESVSSLRLIEKIRKSDEVTPFIFEARDAGAPPVHEAGQHLPIEIHVPAGHKLPVRRTYSLSGAPSSERNRSAKPRASSYGICMTRSGPASSSRPASPPTIS